METRAATPLKFSSFYDAITRYHLELENGEDYLLTAYLLINLFAFGSKVLEKMV